MISLGTTSAAKLLEAKSKKIAHNDRINIFLRINKRIGLIELHQPMGIRSAYDWLVKFSCVFDCFFIEMIKESQIMLGILNSIKTLIIPTKIIRCVSNKIRKNKSGST